MADFTDRIKLIFDAVTGDAAQGVGKLRSEVDEAHGTFGKLKAGAGGALDIVKNNSALAAGGIAALGGAAVKFIGDAVGEFQNLALEAQKFSTASGLAVEDASRWMEVAGDVGVSTETLEGAVNKLNIAASKGVLTQLGIGGDTTNEKLLNALQHLQGIDDASERAKQGMALFGKSWAQLAPLVDEADKLRGSLAAVSDQKVIDESEVQKAKDLRDAMDRLNDTFDDIKLALAGSVIPILSGAADAVGNLSDAAHSLSDTLGPMGGLVGDAFDLLNPISQLGNLTDGLSRATNFSAGWQEQLKGVGSLVTSNIPVIGGWADSLFGADDAQEQAKQSASDLAAEQKLQADASKAQKEAAEEATKALEDQTNAMLASFNSTLAYANASDKTTDAIGKYNTAAATATAQSWGNKEANDAAAEAERGAESAALAQAAAHVKMAEDTARANGETLTAGQRNALLAQELHTVANTLAPGSPLRTSLEGYATQLEQVPSDVTTNFHADISEAIRQIDALARHMKTAIEPPPGVDLTTTTRTSGSAAATAAPSAVVPMRSAALAPAVVAPGMLGAARAAPATTIINVHVSAAPLTNPAEIGRRVADYLDAFYRRSGQRPKAVA